MSLNQDDYYQPSTHLEEKKYHHHQIELVPLNDFLPPPVKWSDLTTAVYLVGSFLFPSDINGFKFLWYILIVNTVNRF